jgi:membrane protein implicated in regulation of membrane protease activity
VTLSDLYLVCLIVGFALSALALFGGHRHVHLPHFKVPGAHIHGAANMPWFNIGTIAAFLAWFGGTGYLLQQVYGVWFAVALAIAVISGIGAASLVYWFLVKVLMSHDHALDPADYRMTGVLGRISLPIRAGGTGELIYSQEGTRRATGVRSEDGQPIPKGAEAIVTRYEKGIAYVRRWEDPLADVPAPEATPPQTGAQKNSQEKSSL